MDAGGGGRGLWFVESQTEGVHVHGAPDELKKMEADLAAERDPKKHTALEKEVVEQRAFVNALKGVVVTPPTLTVPDHMTLYRGGREIQLHFLGRAHTNGDIPGSTNSPWLASTIFKTRVTDRRRRECMRR